MLFSYKKKREKAFRKAGIVVGEIEGQPNDRHLCLLLFLESCLTSNETRIIYRVIFKLQTHIVTRTCLCRACLKQKFKNCNLSLKLVYDIFKLVCTSLPIRVCVLAMTSHCVCYTAQLIAITNLRVVMDDRNLFYR